MVNVVPCSLPVFDSQDIVPFNNSITRLQIDSPSPAPVLSFGVLETSPVKVLSNILERFGASIP